MPMVTVNGVELYHEIRGSGPPVLFIMGATGDGGHFDAVADLLADEFTVVTYDRRGNGRSPVPAGWTTTTPEEQADGSTSPETTRGHSFPPRSANGYVPPPALSSTSSSAPTSGPCRTIGRSPRLPSPCSSS